MKYDPTKLYTDIFFFGGASNVAKAGKVLEAKFPGVYALHGGEHVVSLFFDDLSKEKVVQVMICLSNHLAGLYNCSHSSILYFLRLLSENVAGCIMSLGQEHAMGLMLNSLHSLPLQTGTGK